MSGLLKTKVTSLSKSAPSLGGSNAPSGQVVPIIMSPTLAKEIVLLLVSCPLIVVFIKQQISISKITRTDALLQINMAVSLD